VEGQSNRHEDDRDTLLALTGFRREGADTPSALAYALRLARIATSDPNVVRLKDELERQNNKTPKRYGHPSRRDWV
jgi:hypothetical protein